MQNDYISREAAKHDIVAWAQVITQPNLLSRDDALTALDSIPAADVRPVVRAKWERIPLNMSPEYFAYKWNLRKKCTACSYAMPDEYPDFKICPNCGAEMGGQDNA